jgi:GWxTD domain-containing protein
MGLITATGPLPLVGRITFIAAATPDSTTALVALSVPRRAVYNVVIDVSRQGRVVRHIDTTFTDDREPTVVLALPPGDYQLALAIRDVPSARTASRAIVLTVPYLAPAPQGRLSSAIAVHAASVRTRLDTLPVLAQWPRATAVVGRDTTIAVYVEDYKPVEDVCPLKLQARAIEGSILWRDSITLARTGPLCAGIAHIPLAQLGPGATMIEVRNPAGDTTTVPLFVTLGMDVPVGTYDQQLDYLRYFTTPATLAALRAALPSTRGSTWTAFLHHAGTDSLASYLRVLHETDVRFPEEGQPGWQTPRGQIFLTLGDPEQILLQSASHREIWDYQRYFTRLVFVDDSGTGHWRLTPHSAGDYGALVKRLHR